MKKVSLGLIAIVAMVAFFTLIGLALLISFFTGTSDVSLGGFGEKIAVIPVKGLITMDQPDPWQGDLGADEIVALLDEAENDFTVSAVVLEINSGGGGVVASRYIAQKIQSMEKPVIAFISETGASAAYHIAASADVIVADHDSITGSIGVISMLPNLSQLIENWGIEMKVVKSGEFKDFGNMYREMTPEEEALLQELIDEAYARFKNEIKEMRAGKLDTFVFEEIADGRILTGQQAFEAGLVDELGTKQDAIDTAAELAEIEMPVIEEWGARQIGLLDLFAQSGSSFGQGLLNSLNAQPQNKIQG
jgi:protease-4